MTRETKIGLLVGLAFIIVVAILLSDPVNNANEPPAAIADTAASVRQGLTVPAPTASANDSSTTTIVTPSRVVSREPILTRTEAADQTAREEVKISPGSTPLKPIFPIAPEVSIQSGTTAQDNTVVTPISPTDDLQQTAIKQNEPLIPADSHDVKSVDLTDIQTAGGKRYTAQPGDSVSKMAGRLMGANTKANRAAIVAANPSLKKDPNRVIVGETYVIPGAAAGSSNAPAPTEVAVTPTTTDKTPSRWYVVKPNDNLWRIATSEVGDSSAVSEIISLNKDLLKGGSALQPDMRLRLPPKTVASAG